MTTQQEHFGDIYQAGFEDAFAGREYRDNCLGGHELYAYKEGYYAGKRAANDARQIQLTPFGECLRAMGLD